MWGYHDGFGWWMVFGVISMIVFWGGLLWIAAYIVRSIAGGPGPQRRRSEDDPEEIARRRFAAGEISEDEYRKILRTLHG